MGQKVVHIPPAQLQADLENELGPRFDGGQVAGKKKFQTYPNTANKMTYESWGQNLDGYGNAGSETKQRQYPGPRSKG